MSEFRIIHRTFFKESLSQQPLSQALLWKTCLREIYFSDAHEGLPFQLHSTDETYVGLQAEAFLAEVLCGLKSPLIGETEVFGQFKIWWKNLSQDNSFKRKFQGKVEALFALVKSVREKALCGQGSQSYGSLLRKNLSPGETVDIMGAGHLTQEILPWIENKTSYRIWCRNPQKVQADLGQKMAGKIISLSDTDSVSKILVIAAPISHQELNLWLQSRKFSSEHKIFDFRADSADFVPYLKPRAHLKLQDFSSKYDLHQIEIEKKAQSARQLIRQWEQIQESKAQVRPYGWDDL